jgi:organic hydroperoxide reductase OsmC/OhrA
MHHERPAVQRNRYHVGRPGRRSNQQRRPHQIAAVDPRSLGGDDGPGTNPDRLFAASYVTCFYSALKSVEDRRTGLSRVVQIAADKGASIAEAAIGFPDASELHCAFERPSHAEEGSTEWLCTSGVESTELMLYVTDTQPSGAPSEMFPQS